MESRRAVRKWGAAVAMKYVVRINQLQAATTLQDLRNSRALRFHALKGDRARQSSITLHGQYRLIVEVGEDSDSISIREVTNHYDD